MHLILIHKLKSIFFISKRSNILTKRPKIASPTGVYRTNTREAKGQKGRGPKQNLPALNIKEVVQKDAYKRLTQKG